MRASKPKRPSSRVAGVIRGTLAALALVLILAAPTFAAQLYSVSFHAFVLPKGGVTAGSWTPPVYTTG
jgi:hypothetical protein